MTKTPKRQENSSPLSPVLNVNGVVFSFLPSPTSRAPGFAFCAWLFPFVQCRHCHKTGGGEGKLVGGIGGWLEGVKVKVGRRCRGGSGICSGWEGTKFLSPRWMILF